MQAATQLPTLSAAQAGVAPPLPGGVGLIQDLQHSKAEAGLAEGGPGWLGGGAEGAVLHKEEWQRRRSGQVLQSYVSLARVMLHHSHAPSVLELPALNTRHEPVG